MKHNIVHILSTVYSVFIMCYFVHVARKYINLRIFNKISFVVVRNLVVDPVPGKLNIYQNFYIFFASYTWVSKREHMNVKGNISLKFLEFIIELQR
jgi:hypothetical protein